MKNVNLTGLFLAMVAEFGATGFALSSIVPDGGSEPIDALIVFEDTNIHDEDLAKVNEIIYENITGEVLQAVVKLKDNKLEVYIEFTNSEFLDSLD